MKIVLKYHGKTTLPIEVKASPARETIIKGCLVKMIMDTSPKV
jgi:hypothetical protein